MSTAITIVVDGRTLGTHDIADDGVKVIDVNDDGCLLVQFEGFLNEMMAWKKEKTVMERKAEEDALKYQCLEKQYVNLVVQAGQTTWEKDRLADENTRLTRENESLAADKARLIEENEKLVSELDRN
jgi:hypothetical protein